MNQAPAPTNYRIFLLTVWRDGDAAPGKAVLRFSLHDPRSGQRRGFGESKALLAFLAESTDATIGGATEAFDASAKMLND